MSLYKRLHEAEVPEGPVNRRDPVLDELRQKIHHHLIEELGPVLYDKRLNEQELRRREDAPPQKALAKERAPLAAAAKGPPLQDSSLDVLGYRPAGPPPPDADVHDVTVN